MEDFRRFLSILTGPGTAAAGCCLHFLQILSTFSTFERRCLLWYDWISSSAYSENRQTECWELRMNFWVPLVPLRWWFSVQLQLPGPVEHRPLENCRSDLGLTSLFLHRKRGQLLMQY